VSSRSGALASAHRQGNGRRSQWEAAVVIGWRDSEAPALPGPPNPLISRRVACPLADGQSIVILFWPIWKSIISASSCLRPRSLWNQCENGLTYCLLRTPGQALRFEVPAASSGGRWQRLPLYLPTLPMYSIIPNSHLFLYT
jgi:hypothetical protein